MWEEKQVSSKPSASGDGGDRTTPLFKGKCPEGTEGIGRSSGMSGFLPVQVETRGMSL